MASFDGYKFDIGEQEDPSWNQYLNVLYPSPENLERIANMDLLDRLVEKGDVLAVPREVHHWIYFGSESSRSLFRNAVLTEGFHVGSEFSENSPLPFGYQ
jgi:Regulator of ribonuclease activity B